LEEGRFFLEDEDSNIQLDLNEAVRSCQKEIEKGEEATYINIYIDI
jgi:hypothetical protein